MSRIDLDKYVHPYCGVSFIEWVNGYIVYRRATGDNIELLHIKTHVPGQGTGRGLVLAMLQELKDDPPYESVFGFTRAGNIGSQSFYKALGFDLSSVKGVYADGHAVLFSQKYTTLLELNNVR
jgi:ribosomal protein S18 acetylase RimI-like enzyme